MFSNEGNSLTDPGVAKMRDYHPQVGISQSNGLQQHWVRIFERDVVAERGALVVGIGIQTALPAERYA